MESKIESSNENYAKNFKAEKYVDKLHKEFLENSQYLEDPLRFIYNVLQSGRFKGSKLLDICCGPIVHNIASASAFFSNIVMSDYVEDNCGQLKRWLQGRSNMKQLLDFPAILEGYGGNLENGKQLLEKRIKKCVKQVVRSDVTTENVFLEKVKPEVAPPFDLIISSWGLDAVSSDVDTFSLVLKRVNKLLKPGGGLILIGELDEESWKLGDNEFYKAKVNESDVRKALKGSGFKIVDMKITYVKDGENKTGNMHQRSNGEEDFYCLAAEKLFVI